MRDPDDADRVVADMDGRVEHRRVLWRRAGRGGEFGRVGIAARVVGVNHPVFGKRAEIERVIAFPQLGRGRRAAP